MKWNENTISIVPPSRPKKITGTRFGAILGKNVWSTPFNTWCAITRTYEEPFTDNIYTNAGKIIEPKQAAYIAGKYFWKTVTSPTDIYGEDYFQKTWGDFFPKEPIFGGMWDYLIEDAEGKIDAVLEMKTTKRSEDWLDDIPEYYALQAALYAYLLKCDTVIMVCTILEEKDYQNPENFEVTEENTFERKFNVSERYPDFPKLVKKAEDWWKEHVLSGISPVFDEIKDAELLKTLRANTLNPDTDLETLINEAEELQVKRNELDEESKETDKRLKVLKDLIKETAIGEFREGDKQVVIHGKRFDWTTSKRVSKKIDEDAMKADGVLDKYKTIETVTYTLLPKERKF